jgi:hypothetical protein
MHKHHQDWAHNADIPRGKSAKQLGGPPLSDAEHFWKAYVGWFDMRDLGAVLDHEELAAAS